MRKFIVVGLLGFAAIGCGKPNAIDTAKQKAQDEKMVNELKSLDKDLQAVDETVKERIEAAAGDVKEDVKAAGRAAAEKTEEAADAVKEGTHKAVDKAKKVADK